MGKVRLILQNAGRYASAEPGSDREPSADYEDEKKRTKKARKKQLNWQQLYAASMYKTESARSVAKTHLEKWMTKYFPKSNQAMGEYLDPAGTEKDLASYLDHVTQFLTLKKLQTVIVGPNGEVAGDFLNLAHFFHRIKIQYEPEVFGHRWDVMRGILERKLPGLAKGRGISPTFGAESGANYASRAGLDVLEIGVEKGETLRYLLLKLGQVGHEDPSKVQELGGKNGIKRILDGRDYPVEPRQSIRRYVGVDPWWMEGKEKLDDLLQYYYTNTTDYCKRGYENVCSVVRMTGGEYAKSVLGPAAEKPLESAEQLKAAKEKIYSGKYKSMTKAEKKRARQMRTMGVPEGLHEEQMFDVIFIDAMHDFHNVREDISRFWPLLRQGGVMAGHDFGLNHAQVILAVLNRLTEIAEVRHETRSDQLVLHLGADTTWWVTKDFVEGGDVDDDGEEVDEL